MKNIFTGLLTAAVFAGCATGPQASRDEYDIVPEKSEVKTPTAVEWENANDAQLKAETTPAALHAYLKSAAAADALLAEVKGAYKTDPMTATKIHAVSQLVMSPKTPENRKCRPAECRDLWTAALLRAAKASTDPYRTMFLLDQLRWCGKPSHAVEVRSVGAASDAAEVKAFSLVVARELEGLPLAR